MVETPSTPPSGFDGEALRRKICEKIKSHSGTPEALTEAVAKIILREGLGLADKQITRQYQCFRGLEDAKRGRSDLAITYEDDIDLNITRKNPKILFELKRSDRQFIFGSKNYFEDVDQLKDYMNSLPCQTIEHGIIFNIHQLQVFRKHGNLIFPITKIINLPGLIENNRRQQATENTEVTIDIKEVIDFIKIEVIEQPRKNQRLPGTIITVWNNKGGVGKTTISSYLSLLLSVLDCLRKKIRKNRVLAIDFDHNQANLTQRFERKETNGKTEKLLDHIHRHGNLDQFELKGYFEEIKCKKQRTEIHFLPADEILRSKPEYSDEGIYKKYEEDNCLRRLCLEFAKKYDYIIIDTPLGWEQSVYAQSAVRAADCLLPIGSYGDFDSFHGYYHIIYHIIRDKLPEIRKSRPDMGPDNLGLWINNWRPSDRRQIKIMNSEEFEYYIRISQKEKQQELRRSFFVKDNELRCINYHALIAKGSCRNPDMNVKLLQNFTHMNIKKAYRKLLTSIVGEVQ